MGRAMRRVLVVDNDVAVCDVLELAVEADGIYRASEATTIDDALRIIASDPTDAAVVDAIIPPGQGGLAFARQAIDFGVPVLIITDEPATQQQLTAVGCRYLPKPFRLEALAAELWALIDEATVQIARLSAQLD